MSDRKLTIIQPAELRDVWPSIRRELDQIPLPDGAIPEEVFFACANGGAVLCLLFVDGSRVGWMILRHLVRDFHIWLLYGINGYDVMSVFRDDLMRMARVAGATMLTFGSARRGWEKVAERHGFKIRCVTYECPLDDLTPEIAEP